MRSGADVIAPTSSGLYTWVSGTSLSSPLAARYASSLATPGITASDLRQKVFAARDVNRFLPLDLMPVELSYWSLSTVNEKGPTAFALHAAPPHMVVPRPVR
jgi:hypothetical protein